MASPLRYIMPRSLYGRAALILILPIVTIQFVVSTAFIQRHFEGVTQQMTRGLEIELSYLLSEVNSAPSDTAARLRADLVATALDLQVTLPATQALEGEFRDPWDLSGRAVAETLRAGLPELRGVDLQNNRGGVVVLLDSLYGPMEVRVDRRRMTASNPHQLLVLMIFTSVLMTVIAYVFLSRQLRPIKTLAEAASAFGRGVNLPYRARGALEVRAAGNAFLDMRARIERQIEQRTLLLSGVSHDLRTPLTRLRLGLSLLPEEEEAAALLGDVADMERLVDEFLAFTRGDALEEPEEVDPLALVARVVENAQRAGQKVVLRPPVPGPVLGRGRGRAQRDGAQAQVRMRPAAVTRALENLIGNAIRFGSGAEIGLSLTDRALRLTVEDDGPGIPKERREEALHAFTRLDAARDPNRGGGVGLGLSIAADIARSHGGTLRLSQSERLGGLKAELVLAR